jgi:hypothetical protein
MKSAGCQTAVSEVWVSQTLVRIAKSISGLVGLLLVLMGGIWILQGLNLAWGVLARSFMQNNRHWAVYGAILAAIGLGLIVWGFSRPRKS